MSKPAGGLVYLVASGQDGLLPAIATRAYDALGKRRARVAVTYAPVDGDAGGLKFMSERMPPLFPDAVLETIASDPGVVERADLIFVSGGDPTLGADVLERTGASSWIRAAHARGTPVMGVSAGAIALGDWWVRWPDDEEEDEDLERTSLVRCLGLVAGHVFDTHNEQDDWDELRVAARLLQRQGGTAVFLGIPTRGALVCSDNGSIEVVGESPFRLR
jgi:putative intracellular protease/amidase